MIVIDGAYFEQSTSAFLAKEFSIDLFTCDSPTDLVCSFIASVEDYTGWALDTRVYVSSLFERDMGSQKVRDDQLAMVDILSQDCKFKMDLREFKNMSVYCPNKRCSNSWSPIQRKVQAEVDVAIASTILAKAFKGEFDELIVVTGDRDFKDWFERVIEDAHKPVKIIGFKHSVWKGYTGLHPDLEVLAGEAIWKMAIGKCLASQSGFFSTRK